MQRLEVISGRQLAVGSENTQGSYCFIGQRATMPPLRLFLSILRTYRCQSPRYSSAHAVPSSLDCVRK